MNTPDYITTGAFFLSGLIAFFLGRITARDDYEPYNEKEARGRQSSDLK
jgi:hypothetical protein